MPNLFFGVSLTASFLGGMVALFAPCCITFLFPSYLGTIFKDRTRVVFLTLVFAAGLASILVPVALGMRIIITLFDQFHTTTYLIGALFMFLIGLMTLFEVKLMLPIPQYTMPKQTNVLSTYLLGVFSGITSSCCAPVLFAAITLSSLSPTLLTSLVVSVVYVLGIVFPLFFLSLFYEKLTNQYLYKFKKRVDKPLKIIASLMFMVSAVVISFMGLTCMAVQGGLLTATLAQREQEHHSLFPILSFLIAKIISYTLLGFALGFLGSIFHLSLSTQIILHIAIAVFMIGTALNILKVHPVFRYFVITPPRFLLRQVRNQTKSKDYLPAGRQVFAPA